MSKDIETSGFNGTAAFMEVRVQSIVVEFILTHVEQLFGDAPLQAESPRRSLLLAGGGQPPPYHVPAALSQGDGPPPIRPYHTIIELSSDHRRKGSLKAKKWRSIFHLGRSSHEAKRKMKALEEKEDKGGTRGLRPAKSMDSLSAVPSAGDGERMRRALGAFDACPVPPGRCREPGEGREEPQGDGSARSEPSTPRAGRSRAEKCIGVHISGPFGVTVPLHITPNLSRLTRGLPCPVLGTGAPDPQRDTGGDAPGPVPPSPAAGSRLSMELRDSFAFLDSPEPWLEGAGDGEPGDRELPPGTGPAGEGEGLAPAEPRSEPSGSYLSIEECMDEEMFFMAPDADDTDSDDMFLSAHDELSPLVAALEPPGAGSAPDTPGSPVPARPGAAEEGAPGDAEHPGEPTGARAERGAPGSGEDGARTDPGCAGAGPAPDTSDEDIEEDGAGPGPRAPGSPRSAAEPPVPSSPAPPSPAPGAPVLPEPAAVLRLATRAAPVLQARSVPVVPPKPQFARVRRAPRGSRRRRRRRRQPPEGPARAPGAALRRAGWRAGGSASLEADARRAARRGQVPAGTGGGAGTGPGPRRGRDAPGRADTPPSAPPFPARGAAGPGPRCRRGASLPPRSVLRVPGPAAPPGPCHLPPGRGRAPPAPVTAGAAPPALTPRF
uniref:Rho GTPase activating protein 30 n=1 Tax=Strigops habroptila TaxID=2489341 RepID=A0A672UMB7_STRHB